MPDDPSDLSERLGRFPPFDMLPVNERMALTDGLSELSLSPGSVVFEEGQVLANLYLIEDGLIDVRTSSGDRVSRRGTGDIIGERGLLRDGKAMLTATVKEQASLLLIKADTFHALVAAHAEIAGWFDRATPTDESEDEGPYATGLTALSVSDMMAKSPVTCSQTDSVTFVARIMRDNSISSVLVVQDQALAGIVTVHDMTNKVLAEGLTGEIPVGKVMTANPRTIAPDSTGLDALVEMAEHRINHLPVKERSGRIVGMIAKTDLFRRQAATASHMVAEIVAAESASDMAVIMQRLPDLLTHLVSAGAKPQAICRRITDLTDAVTRRLLKLAENRLGPAPVPYLWAACGSQGRQEQTGVSDQDNCLILDDAATPAHDPYFEALATFVCDGLAQVGFIHCPGDMMATNPRWRQPRRVWQEYFAKWIDQPDNEAQMLASVMFDLRAIAGTSDLLEGLQNETLDMARKNSIFVSHMVGNSLKHTPPLSLFRGFALIRSGEHKNTVDLKHAGVVPIIDLARVYALSAGIDAVNTRKRLQAAGAAGVISASGAQDLVDAYDLIASTRLRHQAQLIADGKPADNYLAPGQLSELERNHLRDAFLVVRTMQSAIGHGRIGMG
ncbi:MAG: putative nucleotidyltransferase substrate binding domain-containing protein [Paracoccaceae bacterium]|jgi:CBS domain-containing protein|nr:putative nucleotidyltransferase substrate binding domain-containing protein [Paracoccaceae bacterium]MDP7185307.1 putative nucleotidyltransferase substrate binding domain-containing protein [Paracoccaceae bacterium]